MKLIIEIDVPPSTPEVDAMSIKLDLQESLKPYDWFPGYCPIHKMEVRYE